MKRRVSLFRNGRNQAIRIPRDMEFAGSQVDIVREGDRLILEPVSKPSLFDRLRGLPPLDKEDWLDEVEELPLDPVEL